MKKGRKIIYLAGFLFAIPVALTSFINSSLLESYLKTDYVGLVYVAASIVTILGLLEMPRVLTKFGNRVTILMGSAIFFCSLILLAFSKNGSWSITAFILYFLSFNLIFLSLDIFIEDFSGSSSVGRFRGAYLMVINTAWVLAQAISGSIIVKSSFAGIYLFSAGFTLLGAAIFLLFLRDFKNPIYKKVPIFKTFKFFIRNKNVSKIYLLNFILKFFFAWMVIYTPIYLHEYLGFDWTQIGIIFTIMLIPYVLADIPLGRLADKVGEKKILLFGFIISTFFTFVIPLIHNKDIVLWAIILFGTRVGTAAIEVMSESYFFKEVGEENADAISFFRNTFPLSYVIAPLVAIPILFLVPSFEYLFYVLAAIMLFGFFTTLRLRDVR